MFSGGLRKREVRLSDRSGYVPHGEVWYRHWSERYGRFPTMGDTARSGGSDQSPDSTAS